MHAVEIARMNDEERVYDAWAAEHADTLAREAYDAWASDALADDPEADVSEDAYVAYLEGFFPEGC